MKDDSKENEKKGESIILQWEKVNFPTRVYFKAAFVTTNNSQYVRNQKKDKRLAYIGSIIGGLFGFILGIIMHPCYGTIIGLIIGSTIGGLIGEKAKKK
ncbi:MAG: glycine zipper domain-containing protein [Promethearchaeota archaeon]